jgi:hypothetical protein
VALSNMRTPFSVLWPIGTTTLLPSIRQWRKEKAVASTHIDAQLQSATPNQTIAWLASSVLLHVIAWANGDLDHLLQKNRDYREAVIRRT